MAAEPDSPKTGMIAWITAISLIMIFVSFVSLQGLFSLWELRHDKRSGTGNLETPLAAYQKEQAARLNTLDGPKGAKKATLDDAIAGKVLAAPPPPAAPAPAKKDAAPTK